MITIEIYKKWGNDKLFMIIISTEKAVIFKTQCTTKISMKKLMMIISMIKIIRDDND